ncbi:MAG: hypothetical protein OQK12_09355 [Motiliproteus sp.]|nr:hypothetical protein [Motiliproteus sp.]MCW9051690.1 hypothetical protein [Motiliproteus sp.]
MKQQKSFFDIDSLENWLTQDQFSTYRLARQWLHWLSDQPQPDELLALIGYYLQQSIGSKANRLLIEKAQSEAFEKDVLRRALGLLAELDSGSDCRSETLETAIRLAESQRFAVHARHSPIRRFLEVSRNYLMLKPDALRRLQIPNDKFPTDFSRSKQGDENQGEKR